MVRAAVERRRREQQAANLAIFSGVAPFGSSSATTANESVGAQTSPTRPAPTELVSNFAAPAASEATVFSAPSPSNAGDPHDEMEIDDDGDGDGDEDDDDSDSYDNDDDYLDPIDDNGDDLFPGQEFSTLIAGPYNEERADEALQVAISHRTLDNMITLKNSFAGHEQVLEYLHTHASSPALSSRDRLISVAMDHLYESSQDSIMHLEKSANADRVLANKRHSDVSACMKELLHRFSKVEIASGLPIMPSHEDNFSPPVRASGAVDPVHLADPTDLAARVSKLDSELKLVKRRADSWEQTAKDQGKELTRMKAKLAASDKKWEEMDAKLRKTVDINNLFAGFFTGKVSPEQITKDMARMRLG